MYSTCTVDTSKFAADVVFDDPAASTSGRAELQEAFRALQVLQPQNLSWELRTPESTGTVEIDLWQQYALGSRKLKLYSRIVVKQNADGQIYSLQDRWHGQPLLDWGVFRLCRRLNGIVSYKLTPSLVASPLG